MSKAAALARSRISLRIDLADAPRKVLVLFCGAALAAAGPLLPALG